MQKRKIDMPFLFIVGALLLFGFIIFTSASMGLITRSGAPEFSSVTIKQIVLGIGLGSLFTFVFSRLPYGLFRRFALPIFLVSIVVTLLVFVPKIGLEFGGGRRWIEVAGYSFQPAEFLKIGFVVFLAAWFSWVKDRVGTIRYGLLPFIIILSVAGAILLKQPDTTTFASLFFAGIGMFVAAGGRFRDLMILAVASAIGFSALVYVRPYLMERVLTFLDPSRDPLGSGYQIQQSLIAVGSGGLFGRGFGQSVQKFNYLPEPIGDSIFAVAGEEFGFVGCSLLILLFLAFAIRGFTIAARSPDPFGRLFVVGIVILIISESFINISSMLGLIPLSGLPLLFVSQGGSAMLFTLLEVGIILNVSRFAKI